MPENQRQVINRNQLLHLWHWWFTPRSQDREEAFRERTIRLLLPVIFLAFILFTARDLAGGASLDEWVLEISINLIFILSAAALLRDRVQLAGILLMLRLVTASILVILEFGYFSNAALPLLLITFILATLLLPLKLIPASGVVIGALFIGLAVWQHSQGVVPGEGANNPPQTLLLTILAVTFTLSVFGVFFFYIRREYDNRVEEIDALVDTLEDRVAARTRELQDAKEKLEAANQVLQKLAAVKDEFVANVSHELRTPIYNIMLQIDLLKMTAKGSDQHRYVTLGRETQRLSNLVESLLLLSRFDQTQVEFNFQEIDLNLLVQEFVSDRTLLAREKNLVLDAETRKEAVIVKADANMIGQVLSILLTNAINFTPSGGQVKVRTGFEGNNGKQWAGFSVEDTGPGIPSQEQSQIFSRFFRGKAASEIGTPGTGLGLAIAKEIVERHQGRIEVESQGIPGEGTHFSVWLPADGKE